MAEIRSRPESESPNANEEADPSEDLRKQNPGQTTTQDLTDAKDRSAGKGQRK